MRAGSGASAHSLLLRADTMSGATAALASNTLDIAPTLEEGAASILRSRSSVRPAGGASRLGVCVAASTGGERANARFE